jgi:tripartite ATP-independent transporter DctM subunit
LFILAGQIGFNPGIAVRLRRGHKFVGHIPGGLAMATVMGATAFKAICGSSAATSATFASVAIPEMQRYGYDKRLSAGIVATVGTLGVIIPPSVTLIILGILTEQSIGQLFMAGIIPGLIIAVFFIGVIYGWAKINPNLAPMSQRYAWKARMRSLPEMFWVFVIFILVVGGIMQGYFTPSEAGAVGTFAVLLLAISKRNMTFRGYAASMKEALRTTIMLLMLIAGTACVPVGGGLDVSLPLNRYLS